MAAFEQTVEAKGHLIDSGIMSRILDRIIEGKCSFQIEKFTVGKTNTDESFARIKIQSASIESLRATLDVLVPLGVIHCGPSEASCFLLQRVQMQD